MNVLKYPMMVIALSLATAASAAPPQTDPAPPPPPAGQPALPVVAEEALAGPVAAPVGRLAVAVAPDRFVAGLRMRPWPATAR